MIRQCDSCTRKTSCVQDYSSAYAGDTSQCCRCTQRAEDDGHCDDCREDAFDREARLENEYWERRISEAREL